MILFSKAFPRAVSLFLVLAVVGILPPSLRAATLALESFNYTDGPLVTMSAGRWATHSGTAGQVEVLSGRATLSATDSEDVNTLLSGQPYPAATNTTLYAGFTVNFTSLPSTSGDYFAHLKDTTTGNFRAKMFALTGGAGTERFLIGIANGTNTGAAAISAANLELNRDHRLYLRYVISSATTTLWVDPASEASPSVTAGDLSPARAVVAIALRQTAGIGKLAVDDLRVGTSFAEVFVAPPIVSPVITQPPLNTAAVEGGTAVFNVVATGSGPLTYQWKFGETELLGATNVTLTINPVVLAEAGQYSVTVGNAAGIVNSAAATLTVITPTGSGTLSLVTYNVKGNFATNWTTDGPQLQAIGRQMSFLQPDLITFNEIPYAKTYEMTNFINVYLPGYFMVTNAGVPADVIRSVILSRYPITRSQAWLANASLTNFGYAGTFTRDLFEAEINVPGATEPLHVFTAHLKSGADADSQDRRAAEANCVSNFLVTVFIPSHGSRPYVLTGDLNDDIALPMSRNHQPIQHLTAAATGLQLTTPLNPFTLEPFTHSIQGSNSLDARFDYILPAGVLAANVVASQVFRTDLLPAPPPPLQANDGVTASDHLPVVMVFNYPDPQLEVALAVSNSTMVLSWPALLGRNFRVETSDDLVSWSVLASNLTALSSRPTWAAPATATSQFYRVLRLP